MKRLKDLREDRDLKQIEVARILGISQQYYQRYESGKNELPLRHAITLAKYYNVSLDYIAGLCTVPRTLASSTSPIGKKYHEFLQKIDQYQDLLLKLENAEPKIQRAIFALLED